MFTKHFSTKFYSNYFINLAYTDKRFKMNIRRIVFSQGSQKEDHTLPPISELKIALAKEMGVEAGYNPIPYDRSHLLKYIPKSQEELPKRSMQDSFIASIIPLSTDKPLQDKYVNFLGNVRLGRLLEDMDLFAVIVAHKHIVNPNLPEGSPFAHTLVTALVDKIDFTEFLPKPQEDIKISGHVSWVGKTSLEVVVWLEQKLNGVWQRITRALFLIAARDSINNKSAVVNAIEPADDREKDILSGGEARKQQRIKAQERHVMNVIPYNEEQEIIHNIYLRTTNINDIRLRQRILPSGCVWMSSWILSNVILSQPEDRNRHNTVFGGFIMRHAVELSWILGYMYSKHRPALKRISDISFQRALPVSSLIHMHAHLVFTEKNYIQIIVYVEIYDPVTSKRDVTNTFHFTYLVPEAVNECIPVTYHEAMMYIDGRRYFLEFMQKSSDTLFDKLASFTC